MKIISKNKFGGFTLIELLVVVAIIGILASVVLASLNSARSKGKVAAIKTSLDQLRNQVAIYESTNTIPTTPFVYCNSSFLGDSTLKPILDNAIANSDYTTTAECNGNSTAGVALNNLNGVWQWSVQVYTLHTGVNSTSKVVCLDSYGAIKEQAYVNNGTACTP